MQNPNRAKQTTKAAHRALQTKPRPSVLRVSVYREVKVVTIREEPRRGCMDNEINSPEIIAMLWNSLIARSAWYHEAKELLVCFCLDTRHRLRNFSLISMGSLNESLAHPREIFRPAIVDSAHSIIIAHNHPSGDPSPSWSDFDTTRRLYWIGDLLQIPLTDSIIIGDQTFFSFRENRGPWPPKRWPRVGVIKCMRTVSSSALLSFTD